MGSPSHHPSGLSRAERWARILVMLLDGIAKLAEALRIH
jgi:hypothetical protein